ncbi:MAG: 6-phosphogluconolactonase [Gemmatimonadaceae bacterium]
MPRAAIRILPSPEAIGDVVADHILDQVAVAKADARRYLLGMPTGRTPRPILAAMARRLAERPQTLAHVTLVMMDEYLVPGPGGLQYAPSEAPWSCHHFASAHILEPLNAHLAVEQHLAPNAVWFPVPGDPAAYDAQISAAGGLDLFLLASGASDGHVAFNPPGSPRDSRTRVIPLSEATRRDNLNTFPEFGTLETVPGFGVSVGVETIVSSKSAMMVVWGAGKRRTYQRLANAERYESDWPATLIHECAHGAIIADTEASAAR